MKEQLIKFETAKLAKEKGFKVECDDYYDIKGNSTSFEHHGEALPYGVCFKPTQSLLQRWLREVHKIDIYILGYGFGYYAQLNNVPPSNQGDVKYIDRRWNMPSEYKGGTFKTYEEALEKGLQEALKLIKSK